MAAVRSTKDPRRYVLDSSSEEDEDDNASVQSIGSSSSGTVEVILVDPPPAPSNFDASAGTGTDNDRARAPPSGVARAVPNSARATSQPRRWGDNDLDDDSDSSGSEIMRSLRQRLNDTLRLTAPTATTTRPTNEERKSHDPLQSPPPFRNRVIDRQKQAIDSDDDDDDEVQILDRKIAAFRNLMDASSAGSVSDRSLIENRPDGRPAIRRRGGYLHDDDSSISFAEDELSSSGSEDDGVWEEIIHQKTPQPRGGNAGKAKELNDDFLAMIPSDSAWLYDTKEGVFYLESVENMESTSSGFAANRNRRQWPKLSIPMTLFRTLYMHQKSGVEWMASLHCAGIGGILGDDMGMGKTYMTLTYLFSLMRCKTIRNALIVVPMSVMRSWEREAAKVKKLGNSKCAVTVLTSSTYGRERIISLALNCSTSNPQLVITTYGLVQSSKEAFMGNSYDDRHWDYVVLDEAHTVKNVKAQTTLACRSICRNPNTRRLMLTGTPLMNNLVELWTLFDWATNHKLLGTIDAFKNRYAKPIEQARDKNATVGEIRIGREANEELQLKLQPFFLQRLKADFLKDQLPIKEDVVVWTHLSDEQRQKYSTYVKDGTLVKDILSGDVGCALAAITWLKMLSSHPLLVDRRFKGEDMKKEGLKNVLGSMDLKNVVKDSAKLTIAIDLIKQLRRAGHRILVFSQSTRMLDILEVVLQSNRIKPSRIDGTTKEKDRQRLVDDFNQEGGHSDVMLLSTKAAGVGLTLTGADRVILYDPAWNPATDSQAVDRAYRIGQTRPVLVYRMITAGTVEEKIYEKQVYKDGIRRTVFTECATIQRYFDRHELRRLFTLAEPGVCSVLAMMRDETKHLNIDWDRHSFVSEHSSVVGVSLHDGLYLEGKESSTNGSDDSPATPFAKLRSEAISVRHHVSSLDLVPLETTPPSQEGKKQRHGPTGVADRPLGRAQRVMARATNDHAHGNSLALGHAKSADSSDNSESERSVFEESAKRLPFSHDSNVVELLDSSTESEDGVDDGHVGSPRGFDYATENTRGSTLYAAVSVPHQGCNSSSAPSVDIHRARELHQSGMPRRSLELLLNVLNSKDKYQRLDPTEKVLLHESIADAAAATGLLES